MSVLVYAENWNGKFKKLTYELLTYGKKLAEQCVREDESGS